ncbi:hypothetical protein AVXHC19_28060 [Acidovorax sacchari]
MSQRSDVAYHDAGGVTGLGYDAAGNLKGVRQDGDGGTTTTTYQGTSQNLRIRRLERRNSLIFKSTMSPGSGF